MANGTPGPADARSKGATVLAGGAGSQATDCPGRFYAPRLGDVTPGMQIHNEETFGPIARHRLRQRRRSHQRANDTTYGLAAYLNTTTSPGPPHQRGPQFGIIGSTTSTPPQPPPFGGTKYNGLGREAAPRASTNTSTPSSSDSHPERRTIHQDFSKQGDCSCVPVSSARTPSPR